MPTNHIAQLNAIHLDLKGVLFKPSYIPQLMRDLAEQKINTVLVEYEDVFPFTGMDIAWDRKTAWNMGTVKKLNREAKKNGIEVIPLQQCLGHLEYLFRWKSYTKYAEDKAYPGTLCLSNVRGRALIKTMLSEVMTAHPESRFIHLGMDEAHNLASCSKCSQLGNTLTVFLNWLNELIPLCEAAGKTPIIWSDMLEDHYRDGVFEPFKDRVIFSPWDYETKGTRTPRARIEGWRVSREWLKTPQDPHSPPIGAGTKFIEDIAPATKKRIAKSLHGKRFDSLFQVDLWTRLGFRVLGAGLIRASADGEVLPRYNHIEASTRSWADAIARNRQLGFLGTSWARGTTFCPPNFNTDLAWPSIHEQSRLFGHSPKPFFPGIPAKTVKRLIDQLGACRRDWSLEGELAEEMNDLRSKLKAHRYEWDSITLMAEVLALHRRADYALLEVDYFHANIRPNPAEWQRRLDDQKQILHDMGSLCKRVHTHFAKRYHGEHFEEWIRELFDLRAERLKTACKSCREKKRKAAQVYGKR
ncbi:MAG: family 20 glycosylhydrolase [Planctomycetota bacterium]|jgi:hypothetical protein